jgi:hypothetical protein
VGLFGFIKKVGGLAKTALSIATHGGSDKVLNVLRKRGHAPKLNTAQAAAVDAKYTPRVAQTESRSNEGWGFAKGPVMGKAMKRRRGTFAARNGRGSWRGTGSYEVDPETQRLTGREWVNASGMQDFDAPGEYRFTAEARQLAREEGGAAPARRAAKRARRPKARRSGVKRRPPTGGLNLKALSASWRAAGKPGTWQGWIQANK